MTRVLLISFWSAPPENAATARIDSWIKYLPDDNLRLTVLCFNRNKPAINANSYFLKKQQRDVEQYTQNNVRYITLRMQYNLRDYLIQKKKWLLLRKTLSLVSIVTRNFSMQADGVLPLYREAVRLLKNEKFDVLLVSGRPFSLFIAAHKLSKKFGLKWIADYRDGWSSSSRFEFGAKGIHRYEKIAAACTEKRVLSASAYITVSAGRAELLQQVIEKPVQIVYNGFYEDQFEPLRPKFEKFTIVYAGSIYAEQNFEPFVEAMAYMSEKYNGCIDLIFAGSSHAGLQQQFANRCKGVNVRFTAWMPNASIIGMLQQAHVLFYTGWTGYKGILSTKIFEYMGSGSHVLLCPGDAGELDRIIEDSGCGKVANTANEAVEYVEALLLQHSNQQLKPPARNTAFINQFTRKQQAHKMADIIGSIEL